jgi:predicted nucleotidyltransferase
MSSGPTKRALEVAEQETAELVDAGAQAVILTGSHARGDAHAESDLDLRVIGDGPPEALKRHEEFLVSISWQELEKHREDLEDPSAVGTVVPGWRTCVIIHDPDGLAAKLKAEAEEWDWDRIAEKSDEWVAHEVTDFAEEVHTLIGNLDMDQLSGAAAIRSQLAMNLAQVLSVHRRILYETENELWDRVADEMGRGYAAAQELALGVKEASLKESCDATLELFGIVAAEARDLLSDTQREIVAHACRLAGHPLP